MVQIQKSNVLRLEPISFPEQSTLLNDTVTSNNRMVADTYDQQQPGKSRMINE